MVNIYFSIDNYNDVLFYIRNLHATWIETNNLTDVYFLEATEPKKGICIRKQFIDVSIDLCLIAKLSGSNTLFRKLYYDGFIYMSQDHWDFLNTEKQIVYYTYDTCNLVEICKERNFDLVKEIL